MADTGEVLAEVLSPYLGETWSDWPKEFPVSDDFSSNAETHDVNKQMLAKEYRRGLRIRGHRTFRSQTLDFLFGDE